MCGSGWCNCDHSPRLHSLHSRNMHQPRDQGGVCLGQTAYGDMLIYSNINTAAGMLGHMLGTRLVSHVSMRAACKHVLAYAAPASAPHYHRSTLLIKLPTNTVTASHSQIMLLLPHYRYCSQLIGIRLRTRGAQVEFFKSSQGLRNFVKSSHDQIK